jgi:hypothetical protein
MRLDLDIEEGAWAIRVIHAGGCLDRQAGRRYRAARRRRSLRNSIPQSQIKDVSSRRREQTMNRAPYIASLSSNLDGQLRQLQNALRVLAKPEHKLREQAVTLRETVSLTWGTQAAQGKWFPWPTTVAPRGNRGLRGICWRQRGMLGFLGYHVGQMQPTPRDVRQCILEYTFECHLPPLNDLDYYFGWGEPLTPQRLKKLADTLAALTRNAKRRDVTSYATAIDDWEDDLALLRNRYYIDYFHFGWPGTDTLH